MRFGLNFFPSFRLDDMSTAEYFSLGLSLSERAAFRTLELFAKYVMPRFEPAGGSASKQALRGGGIFPQSRKGAKVRESETRNSKHILMFQYTKSQTNYDRILSFDFAGLGLFGCFLF